MSVRRLARIDALLLLMAIIWGTNYSIVKAAFAEIDPQAFNALRMLIASAVFLGIILALQRLPAAAAAGRRARFLSIFRTDAAMTRRDWLALAGLGFVGHFLYQVFFIGGLAATSVANGSLIQASTPVVIAMVSAAIGQERVSGLHWLGATLSVAGIAVVVGQVANGGSSLRGDLMMFAAVCCWAAYTIGARPLMERHSPFGVTGLSMAMGSAIYVPVMWRPLTSVDWPAVTPTTWFAILYSALFALCVAYTLWYLAIREIGSARTSVYSNLVPLVAMLTAVVFLGELLSLQKLAGAAAVLVGVALTRVGRSRIPVPAGK